MRHVQFSLNENDAARLDAIVAETGIPKNQLLSAIVHGWLDRLIPKDFDHDAPSPFWAKLRDPPGG